VRAVDPASVAICTVHGNGPGYDGAFAEAHPWPRLQLEQLRRHTPAGYRVYAYGHRIIDAHAHDLASRPEVSFIRSTEVRNGEWPHVWPLRNWLARRALADGFTTIVHLDSDAFPCRGDWLDRYAGAVDESCPVVAVQRLENGDTHSDRCFLLYDRDGFRRWGFDFSTVGVSDAGGGISATLEAAGVRWWPLNRSNAHDHHPLIAGLYDDRIYHHAAGSRVPRFRMNLQQFSSDEAFAARETALHRGLMSRLFADPEGFLAELRGEVPPTSLEPPS
jgi:hypothetical protein